MLAVFLAAHLALIVPMAFIVAGWDRFEWLGQLHLDSEETAANFYSGILWGAVAALAAAQLFRPEARARTPRWLWVLGWLSAALFAALVAVEEIVGVKDLFGQWGALYPYLEALRLANLPVSVRWAAVVALPFAPLAAAAAWVAYVSTRRHPALALLLVLALALGAGAILRDALDHLYGTKVAWPGFVEDASEFMAAAILAVVLVERVAPRRGSGADTHERHRQRGGRWAALGLALALLAAGVPALFTAYEWEEAGSARPLFYAGPVSQLEQPWQPHLDQLTRVKVWAFVDGIEPGPDGAAVEVLARLTPWGADTPVAEARAEVRHLRSDPSTVDLAFAPIPDSGGQRYVLTIRSLREARPYLFLGLTGNQALPLGVVLVNGEPHERRLAMSTHAVAHGYQVVHDLLFRDPQRLLLIADVVVTVFLWVFAAVAAWRGLTGSRDRFWRGYVWPAAQQSSIITAGLAVIAIVLLQVLSAAPHA